MVVVLWGGCGSDTTFGAARHGASPGSLQEVGLEKGGGREEARSPREMLQCSVTMSAPPPTAIFDGVSSNEQRSQEIRMRRTPPVAKTPVSVARWRTSAQERAPSKASPASITGTGTLAC